VRTHGLWFDVNCSILFTELPLVSLNFHTGDMAAGVDRDTQDAVAIGNLRLAAQAASKVGASVLVEAINSVDVPGFPIDTSARAMAVIRQAGAGNVGFLADLYHLAKMGEDVADVLDRYRDSTLREKVGP
jgi:hydroxypyruvate isomerase